MNRTSPSMPNASCTCATAGFSRMSSFSSTGSSAGAYPRRCNQWRDEVSESQSRRVSKTRPPVLSLRLCDSETLRLPMRNSVMRLGNITVVGLKSIARNKLRSLLTALGVVIGVACVIVSVAIGAGVAASVSEMINSLGSNFIMIMPGATTQGGARMFGGTSSLTEDDAAAIVRECPAVAYVSPQVRTTGQIASAELNWSTQIYGVDVDWSNIRAWAVKDGTFFTDGDVRSAAKVAVLGTTVSDNLFPNG